MTERPALSDEEIRKLSELEDKGVPKKTVDKLKQERISTSELQSGNVEKLEGVSKQSMQKAEDAAK